MCENFFDDKKEISHLINEMKLVFFLNNLQRFSPENIFNHNWTCTFF